VTLEEMISMSMADTQPARAESKLPKRGLSFGAVERRRPDMFIA
jgi:hypothetical protein